MAQKKVNFSRPIVLDFQATNKERSFNETIKYKKSLNIKEFFKIKQDVFYRIPKEGKKSHTSLINDSTEFINNYINAKDVQIENLTKEIESLENELLELEQPDVDSNPFYPNNTFIRSNVLNTSGLPIWIMIQGVRREFKSYDVYKKAKLALGFSENERDTNIAQEVTEELLDNIPAGDDINNDKDLVLIDRIGTEGEIIDFDPNAVISINSYAVQCFEKQTYDNKGFCSIKYLNLVAQTQEVEFPLGGVLSNETFEDAGVKFTVGPRLDFQPDPNSSLPLGLVEAKGYMRFYKGSEVIEINPPSDKELGGPPQYASDGITRMFTKAPPDGDGYAFDPNCPDISNLFSEVLSDPDSYYYKTDYSWTWDHGTLFGGVKEKGRGTDVYGAPILRYDNEYIVELKSTTSEAFDRVYYAILTGNKKGQTDRLTFKKWEDKDLFNPSSHGTRLKYDPYKAQVYTDSSEGYTGLPEFKNTGYTYNRNNKQSSKLG